MVMEFVKAYDFVHDLERLEDGVTTTKAVSMYEFYRLLPGKKTIKVDNIAPDIGRHYLVYSGLSDVYYKRVLSKEEDIVQLQYDIELGAVHLIWDEDRQREVKEAMEAVSSHHSVPPLKYYKQYIPLIENTILYDSHKRNNKSSEGFHTKSKQYEQRQRKLLGVK
jgi:hypothetical protein